MTTPLEPRSPFGSSTPPPPNSDEDEPTADGDPGAPHDDAVTDQIADGRPGETPSDPTAPLDRAPSAAEGLKGRGWTQPNLVDPLPGDDEPVTTTPVRGSERLIEGDVRGFRERIEQRIRGRPRIIWTFRVERYDDRGNRLQSVPVTMQSRRISGYLSDGNRVRVRARRRPSGNIRVTRIENLTTGSEVVASRFSGAPVLLVGVLALAAIAYGGFRIVQSLGNPLVGGLPAAPAGVPGASGAPPSGFELPTPQTEEPSPSPSVEEPSPSPSPEPAPVLPFLIACSPDGCLTSEGGEAYDVTVSVGTGVEWRNETKDESMKLYLPEGFEGADEIGPGESFILTPDQAGTVDWRCRFSSDVEHAGRVTVTEEPA